jgi:hypothetical protein
VKCVGLVISAKNREFSVFASFVVDFYRHMELALVVYMASSELQESVGIRSSVPCITYQSYPIVIEGFGTCGVEGEADPQKVANV